MSATRPLTTFHPFSRLPKELRIEIWRAHLTSMEPRTIKIRSDSPNNCNVPLQNFCSSDPTPSVLHVCHESHLEALRYYVVAFTDGLDPRYIWINFNLDTINLRDVDLWKVSDFDKSCIRHLIIEAGSANYFHGGCRGEFRPMINLAKLQIISPEFLFAWGDLVGLTRKNFLRWFAHVPDYVCPEIRIIQQGTQWELNIHNYEAMHRVWREQTQILRQGRAGGIPGWWENR